MNWKQIDFLKRIAVIKEHKTIKMQKTPQPRVIPLHPVVINLLNWIREHEEGEYVFVTSRGTKWDKDTLDQQLRRARGRAGVSEEVKLYCTRHSFGTRGILNGVDMKSLSAVMGHTTAKMCEHYIHLAGKHEHLEQSMLKVNAPTSSKPRAVGVRRGA